MKTRKHLLTTFSVLLIAALLVACVSPLAPIATTVSPTAMPYPPTTDARAAHADTDIPNGHPHLTDCNRGVTNDQQARSRTHRARSPARRSPATCWATPPPAPTESCCRPAMAPATALPRRVRPALVHRQRRLNGRSDAGAYMSLLREDKVQEMIFVFPDASNTLGGSQYRVRRPSATTRPISLRSWWSSSTPLTVPSRTAIADGVTGCSMGGDRSMDLAFKYPDVFSVGRRHPAHTIVQAIYSGSARQWF